MSLIGLQVHKL